MIVKNFPVQLNAFLYLLMILTSPVRCHLSNDNADRKNVRSILIVKLLKCQNYNTKNYTYRILVRIQKIKVY